MKKVLLENYSSFYKSTKTNVDIDVKEYSADFYLFDKKSCDTQRKEKCSSCDTSYILEVKSNAKVYYIAIEEFIKQFGDTNAGKGKRCDCLLYEDNQKIVFVELSCLEEKYVLDNEKGSGKRAKAYNQLDETVRKLQNVPEIMSKMNSYYEKYCLFAWRNSRDIMNDNRVEVLPMRDFVRMSDEIEQKSLQSDMKNGFSFIENKYPTVYMW